MTYYIQIDNNKYITDCITYPHASYIQCELDHPLPNGFISGCYKYIDTNEYQLDKEKEKTIFKDDIEDLRDDRTKKVDEIKEACQKTIYSGVGVETSKGNKHFSLETHDQTELMGLKPQLDALIAQNNIDSPTIPYHADGELCEFWNAQDFGAIIQSAMSHIFYHRTYCNHLLVWVRRVDESELPNIFYGAELPHDLAENMQSIISAVGG